MTTYTNGNPLKYTDPTGHCIDGISTAFCVAFGLVALTVALSSIQGDSRDYHAPIGNAVAFVGGLIGGIAAAYAAAAPAIVEGCAANEQCQQTVQEATTNGQDAATANEVSSSIENITGGRRFLRTDDWAGAEKIYDTIRNTSRDIGRIADNTGLSEDMVSSIKQHVFYDAHPLDRYGDVQYARFDADPAIANAWERLTAGDFTSNDLLLLNHEYYEKQLMDQGLGYSEAHNLASEQYPWKP